jgi:hypothetical protein
MSAIDAMRGQRDALARPGVRAGSRLHSRCAFAPGLLRRSLAALAVAAMAKKGRVRSDLRWTALSRLPTCVRV